VTQVQREPAGGVAPGQEPDGVRRQGDPGATDPGCPAAAGQEEDGRGRRGHLLHVPRPHHCAGKPTTPLIASQVTRNALTAAQATRPHPSPPRR